MLVSKYAIHSAEETMKQALIALSALLLLTALPLLAVPVATTPEPSTFGLMGAAGAAGALMLIKKLRNRNK